jgi:hypothetical protein
VEVVQARSMWRSISSSWAQDQMECCSVSWVKLYIRSGHDLTVNPRASSLTEHCEQRQLTLTCSTSSSASRSGSTHRAAWFSLALSALHVGQGANDKSQGQPPK